MQISCPSCVLGPPALISTCNHLTKHLPSPTCLLQGLACVVYAVALMGYRPGKPWLVRCHCVLSSFQELHPACQTMLRKAYALLAFDPEENMQAGSAGRRGEATPLATRARHYTAAVGRLPGLQSSGNNSSVANGMGSADQQGTHPGHTYRLQAEAVGNVMPGREQQQLLMQQFARAMQEPAPALVSKATGAAR